MSVPVASAVAHPSAADRPRVAILATHGGHAGGAAIAMERIAAGMRRCGAVVDVIARDDVCPERLAAERQVRRAVKRGRTAESNTMFTLDWPAWDVASHPAVAAADVVNLHWVAGFLGAESIRRLVAAGKQVLWTLHDMRPFTGGCHYSSGCEGFTAACAACPQVTAAIREAPRRAATVAARRLCGVPLTFVCPSRWLAGELVRSGLHDPAAHRVAVIPNGLDLDRYTAARDQVAIRRRLGLPERGLGILIGSVSLDERRKGAREAAAAIAGMRSLLRSDHPPFVVTYGASPPPLEGIVVRHLGLLDEAGVIEALHASDIHFTMTREDNLPNTVMEAMACGVPVVGTAVGGLPDMVNDGVNGWLVPVDDSLAAAAVLARLADRPDEVASAGRAARGHAVAAWDERRAAACYLELVASRRPQAVPTGPVAVIAPSPAAAGLLASRIPFRGARRAARRLAALGHLRESA